MLSPKLQLFYSGDTGYSRDFADIQARFASRQGPAQGGGFDLALLPVGAYEPRWFMKDQHVNPRRACASTASSAPSVAWACTGAPSR